MKARRFHALLLPLAVTFHPLPLFSNPIGGTVTAGSATIAQQGAGVLHINQTSDRAIINWNRFSIGAGEITRFNQPSANSSTLNRVLSGNPSEIYGTLQANGHVYLINPSGILVGPSGQINTHSFMGSTLNVSDVNYLSGVAMRLSGSSTASVKNQGSIEALGGDVFLFAHTVENSGTIHAPGGTVGLAAGSEVLLQQAGVDERIAVSASTAPQAAVGVNNVGAIQAATAELKAAGGNIYALAVNNGGVVRANGLVQENGRIFLRATGGNIQNSGVLSARNADGSGGSITVDGGHNAAAPATVINSGSIDASGTKGGEVKVLGDHVGLFDAAVVDVSGATGGGTALIGGDYRGQNAAVQNAQATVISPGTQIRADAVANGNGGKVVVWSDDFTRVYGSISARGAAGGRGGFIETSSKGILDLIGAVVSTGPGGLWLLDPRNVTIQNGATAGGAFDSGSPNIFTPTADDAIADRNVIQTSLNGGTSVTITTGTDGLQAGNITVMDSITRTAGGITAPTLTLSAAGSIIVNAPIAGSAGHPLNVDLQAGASGNVTVANPITTFGGTFSSVGLDFDNTGGAITTAGGTVTINHGGSITIGAAISSVGGADTDGGNVNLTSVGLASITALIDAEGGPAATIGRKGGNVSITGGDVSVAAVNSSGSDGAAGNHDGGAAGTITIHAADVTPSISLNGNLTAAGGASGGGGSSVRGAGANITLMNPTTLGADLAIDTGATAGNIAFQSTLDGAKALDLTAGSGNVTFSGNVGAMTLLGAVTFHAANNVQADGSFSSASLNQAVAASGTTTFASTITTAGGLGTAGGNVVLNSVGLLTISGAIDTRGGIASAAGQNGGNVTLTGGDVVANAINTSGSGASAGNNNGGNAGTISLNAAGGSPTVTLNGNLTAAGGTATGSGTAGAGTDITLMDPVTLGADVVVDTGATAGNIAFQSTISGGHALDLRSGAGTITLAGAAGTGVLIPLSSLTAISHHTGAGDAISLQGVKTTGNQSYTADTLKLNGDLSGAGSLTLQPSSSATSIGLGGDVGTFNLDDIALAHLLSGFSGITIGRADGMHAINILTATFNDPVTIQTPLGGSISVNGLITGAGNASVKLNAPSITLNAGITTASQDITLMGPTTLGNAVALTTGAGAGNIDFTSTLDGAKTLSLTAGSGNITFEGVVGGLTPLGAVTINAAGTVQASGSFSAASINQAAASSGITMFQSISTAGGADAAGGAVTLSSLGVLTINGTIDTRGGAATAAGKNGGVVGLTGGGVVVGAIDTSGSDASGVGNNNGGNAGTITLNSVGGSPSITLNGNLTAAGGVRTGTGIAGTGAGISLMDPVTLGNGIVIDTGANAGSVTFASTVNGANSLTVNSVGATVFSGVVGGIAGLNALTTDAGGTVAFNFAAPSSGTIGGVNAVTLTLNDPTTLNITGGTASNPSIKTSGSQNYNAAVTLSQNTVLNSSGGASIAFGSTLDGAHSQAVNTVGATTFGGVIGGLAALTTLTTDAGGTVAFNFAAPNSGVIGGVNAGTLTLNDLATLNISGGTTANPSVKTGAGGQAYNAAVTLSQDTVLASTLSGPISFASTLNGGNSLAINTAGATSFGGLIGEVAALTSLTTDVGGTVAFNITAAGTVAGVNAGSVTLNDAATLNISSSTAVHPSISTSAGQNYNAAVTLAQDTILESTAGGNIAFTSTINSQTAGSERALQINTTGNESFGGRVGGTVGLLSLTTDADPLNRGGQTLFNVAGSLTATPTVKTTTGDQIYNDAVQLILDTVLTASGASGSRNITFNQTVNGAHNLTVNTPGVTHFDAQVGLLGTPLTSLTTDAAGHSELCAGIFATTLTLPDLSAIGGTINSAGALTYSTALTLCSDTTITAPSVSFSSTVDGTSAGTEALAVVGNATFSGAVGLNFALKSVSVTGSSAINGGAVKTVGDQTYTGPVTLGNDAVLTGANPLFGATVTGNNHNLTLNFSGATLIDGAAFTGIKNLASGNGGLTQIENAIVTTGSQTYDDDVQLLTSTTVNTSGGGGAGAAISFNGKLDGTTSGGETLGLTAGSGNVTFVGAVGSTPLGTVTIDSAHDVTAAAFNSASLRQVAGSGTTTLNGPVNTTTPAGVDLTTATISINGHINTAGGAVNLAGTTAIDSSSAGSIATAGFSVGGAVHVSASGSGTINLQGAIDTHGAGAAFGSGADGGLVSVSTVGGALAVGDITTSGGSSGLFFGGNAGPISLSAGGASSVTLNGNLTALGGSSGFSFPGAGGTISMNAGNGVNQSIGNVVGSAILLTGSGNFSLTHAGNNVDVIVASVMGPISYTDADTVHVGTVGGMSGITAGNNQVTLTADQLEIDQAVSSGTARTILRPLTAGLDVELGDGTLVNRLNLSQTELSRITAGVLEISQAGHIDVSAPIALNPGSVSTLSLLNNGAIDGVGTLAVQNLRINSTGPVNLFGSVTTLAASLSGANQSFAFQNLGDLTVGGVDSIAGVSTTDGNLTLVSGGKISLANDLQAGAGAVTLSHGDTLSGAGHLNGSSLTLQGAGAVGAAGAGNGLNTSVDSIALAKSGGDTFLNQDTARAVDVGGASGGGSVTLSAGATTVNNTALDAGSGNVTLNTTTLGLAQDVSGASVTINNSGALTRSAGSVNGNTLTLQGAGQVGASGAANNLNTSVGAVVLAKSGGDTFLNQDIAKTADIGGVTGGGDVTFSGGATTVNNTALDAGAGNVTLNTTTLGLAQNVVGTAVTFNNSAALTRNAGTVNASTLTLQGSGSVGASLAANNLNASVNTISFAKNGGNSFISQDTTKTVDIEGTTVGGSITLRAGATTVNTAALDAGAGNVTLNTTSLGLSEDVKGSSVTINNSGALTRSAGTVSGNALTLQGSGAVGASGAANNLNTSVGSVSLAKSGGDSFLNQDTATAVDIGGVTGGGNVTVSAGATAVNSAALDAGTGNVVLNTTSLGLAQDVRGASVTINNSAALTRTAGTVSANTLTLQGGGQVGASGAASSLNTSASSIVLGKSGGDTFLAGNGAVDIRGATGGGSLALDAGAGDVTVDTAALNAGAGNVTVNAKSLHLGQKLTANDLQVTTAENITQDASDLSRGLAIAGNASFTAGGAKSISLANDGNSFGGAVSFHSSNPGTPLSSVTVHDTSDFDIQSLTVSGALEVKSTSGKITQSGDVSAQQLSVDGDQGVAFGNVNVVAGVNVRAAHGSVSEFGAIHAQNLTASAGGNIILGVDDRPGAPLPQTSVNSITTLGSVSAGPEFYLYNSGDLNVVGPISAGTVIIRTVGNLALNGTVSGTAGGFQVLGTGPFFNIVLSAEGQAPLQPKFINNAGALAISSGSSRFLVFSFEPNPQTFNGLPSEFQNRNSSYATPNPVLGGPAFLFSNPNAQIEAASETAKIFVDVLGIKVLSGPGVSDKEVKEIECDFPTICTSSYEIYRDEAATKKKKKPGKTLTLLRP